MPETNFENPTKRAQIFSIDALRNPEISLDRNKSGQYGEFLYKASSFLQRVTQERFWTPETAQSYADGYRGLQNALEVMRRNTLLKNIVEDRPMDMTWGYNQEENTELYSMLDQMLSLEQLNALQKKSFE